MHLRTRFGLSFTRLATCEFVVQSGHLCRELSFVAMTSGQLCAKKDFLGGSHDLALFLLVSTSILADELGKLHVTLEKETNKLRADPFHHRPFIFCTPIGIDSRSRRYIEKLTETTARSCPAPRYNSYLPWEDSRPIQHHLVT